MANVEISNINSIAVAWTTAWTTASTTGGNNQTVNIFAAIMELTLEETRRFNTWINFENQFGKAMGALYGGKIIPYVRKRVLSF